jgi:hypothetical protein
MSAAPSRSGETPSLFYVFFDFLVAFFVKSDGFPRSAMARRPFCVTATIRKSQETRSQIRPLSTFPYVKNALSVALSVAQARLRGVLARRREGYFSDWSPYKYVYRHTPKKAQMSMHDRLEDSHKFSNKNTTCRAKLCRLVNPKLKQTIQDTYEPNHLSATRHCRLRTPSPRLREAPGASCGAERA